PRRTAAYLLALGGGGGAALFAMASSPAHVQIAMVLIGIGCSPVLMASYYIFARIYSPRVFATLAGAVIGIGALGNIAGSLPMAWAVEAFGWRATMSGLAMVTLLVAVGLLAWVQDPPSAQKAGGEKGSVLDLLKIPALWAILPLMFVNYAAPAGLRGLWAGPFLKDVYGLDASGIGAVTLAMGLAMVVGNFAYGPLDRLFHTRKWVIFAGNMAAIACLFALWAVPQAGLARTTLLLAAIGLFGSSFPMIVAHARAFFAPHLVGRGVTLINMFGIGGVGVFQFASGNVFAAAKQGATGVAAPYQAVFLFFAVPALIGCLTYLLSRDRLD
ncbi:MAG TPA: MFS transporter, partial [Rhodobacteraceae bacterium]|nr:MFS transporter [Paracoccaceae bacterium]